MAIFAFYPASPHMRRPDGIGSAIAESADEVGARSQATWPNRTRGGGLLG